MKTSGLGPWYLSFAVALALMAGPRATSAQTIATFDDDRAIGLRPGGGAGYCPIETGYVGFYWTGFGCQSPYYASPDLHAWLNPTAVANGYEIGKYAPPYVEGARSWTPGVAVASPGSSITADDPFDFNRAWVAADLRNDMWLNAWGYTNGTASYFRSFMISATSPTLMTFDFLGVDRVAFGWGAGGTIDPHAYYISPDDESIRTYGFAIDEVVFNDATVTPEPSTWIMLATGLLGLGIVARRRRRDEDEEVDRNAPSTGY